VNILGVVGGIGSGKSLVSQFLAQKGAVIIDADRIGHEVLKQPAVKEAIQKRFGDSVFDLTGEVDRRKLAAIVFAPAEKGTGDLAFLKALTHPRITEESQKILAELKTQNAGLVVLDAPLLFESRWNELTTKVIFVDAPESVRRKRCEQRGWSRAEFQAREAAQWPVDKKRELADYVLPNAGTPEKLEEEVRKFLETFSRLNPPKLTSHG